MMAASSAYLARSSRFPSGLEPVYVRYLLTFVSGCSEDGDVHRYLS